MHVRLAETVTGRAQEIGGLKGVWRPIDLSAGKIVPLPLVTPAEFALAYDPSPFHNESGTAATSRFGGLFAFAGLLAR